MLASWPVSTQSQRIASVDALRGLAVVLMVQQHLGAWLLDFRENFSTLRTGWVVLNATGGAAAPLFITLSGVGVALGPIGAVSDRQLRLRGLGLLIFGLLLNLLTPGWFSPWSFYVLHLLGCFLLLAPLARRLSDLALLVAAGAVLACGAAGQAWLETPLRLKPEAMGSIELAGGPLRLALFEGQFPLFPWLSLALGGLWAGRRIIRGELFPLLVAGAMSGGAAGGLRALTAFDRDLVLKTPFRSVFRFTFYPPTSVFILALFGICLGLLVSFLWLEQRKMLTHRSLLVPLGQSSLSLLFVHVVLFREWGGRWGLRQSLDPLPTLAAIALTLAIWTVLAQKWRGSGYRFGLEWCLRRIGRMGSRAE